MLETAAQGRCGRGTKMTDDASRRIEFSRLMLALNQGLLGDDPWREFLLMLRDQTNARYGTLILTPPDLSLTTMITPTATSESIQRYLDRYLEIDPFVNLPEGKVMTLYEYVGEAALKNSAYYKEWIESMDGSHVLGVDLRMSGGFEARLRLTRAPGGDPFNREETSRVEEIVPHLRQAIELFQRLETSRSEQAVMIGAIEQFAVGTVILDHDLKVLKVNEVAASILADGDGIGRRRIPQEAEGGRVGMRQRGRPFRFPGGASFRSSRHRHGRATGADPRFHAYRQFACPRAVPGRPGAAVRRYSRCRAQALQFYTDRGVDFRIARKWCVSHRYRASAGHR